MSFRKHARPFLAFLTVCAALLALAAAASASPFKAGPLDPQTGFPAWYEDTNGIRLEPCVFSLANCFLGSTVPNAAQPFSVPGNSPSEIFYYDVDSTMTSANGGIAFLRVALEGGFSSASGAPEAGKQAVFARVRVRVDNLVPGATYTVTHPWGVETLVAGASARRSINFTSDVGCPVIAGSPPCDFNLALAGAVGPFFGWDAGAPAGFLGSFAVPHMLAGTPLVSPVFRIEGPDVGGPGVNMIETDQFQLSAQVAGALVATPATFGLQRTGIVSAPRTVTVTNTSALPVTLGAAAISGSGAGDFALAADTCSKTTLAADGTCTVGVTFTPTAAGDRLATLSFAGDDMTVLLSGTGIAPALSFGPGVTSVPFGSQRIATTLAHPVVITNTGLAPMNVTGASLAGADVADFALSANTCIGIALASGASCTITVDFTPSSVGGKTAELRVLDDAPGAPHVLPVTGTGTSPTPVLSGTALTFAPQSVNTMSAAQSVSIGNSGTTTLLVGAVAVTGAAAADFQASGCAGANVAPGASCPVNVRFAPSAAGAREATLTITDDTGAHAVALRGTGVDTFTAPSAAQPSAPPTVVQPAAPQVSPASPVSAQLMRLAPRGAARATRIGKTIVVREAIVLAAPATLDVTALESGKRLVLLRGSRLGTARLRAAAHAIVTRAADGRVLALELRLTASKTHRRHSYRIVVHARNGAGAAMTLVTNVRL